MTQLTLNRLQILRIFTVFQVLNMQQYSPENITVKLNGNELTVTASLGGGASNTDDFRQVHAVPEGIDLDQVSML